MRLRKGKYVAYKFEKGIRVMGGGYGCGWSKGVPYGF